MTPAQKTDMVQRLAVEAGFEQSGVAAADPVGGREYFDLWLDRGRHGEMTYLARTRNLRVDPRLLLEGAKSVIVVAHQYKQATDASMSSPYPPLCREAVPGGTARGLSGRDSEWHQPAGGDSGGHEQRGRVARYAWGRDYHTLIRKRLTNMAESLHEVIDEPFQTRVCVDTAPIVEREVAAAAGIGWIGKNTMVLHPELGSFFFLGEILTTLDLEPSPRVADRCGSCTRCLDACPSGALLEPYQMDATRCIAYLTIEHRGGISEDLQGRMGDWVFGCDVCQEACPYNRKAPITSEPDYELNDRNPLVPRPALDALLNLTEEERRRHLAGSAMKRATLDMLHRNATIARRNVSTALCAVWAFTVLLALAMVPAWAGPAASQPADLQRAGDWPLWGGKPDRNMVSDEKGVALTWDVAAGKNVKWVADLGTQTYGNPVVGGGKVFIGTNNGQPRNPKVKEDKGVLMCFAESDGRFLWQAIHDKAPGGSAHDWPEIGICSTPCVVGDRLYYVSNRCELVCADTEGFLDGENDGPITDERLTDKTDADFIWKLDMMKKLGVVPYYASASAPLVVGDLVFLVTGNGTDNDLGKPKAPEAPSFIAVHRATGDVVWSDHSPGDRILAGQWSSPAYGVVQGEPQVVFPGGDGWLYAFEPATGRLLWKFNCNANASASATTRPGALNYLVATPVYHGDRVYVAMGQDPAGGDGEGCLWAVDATRQGDVTATAQVWHLGGKEFGRSVSNVAVGDGLLYAAELGGYLDCFDAATGKRHWRYDLKAPVWASPLLVEGRVYIGNEDGDVRVFQHGKEAARILAENHLPSTVHATAVVAHGCMYLADVSHLYAIAEPRSNWPQWRGAALNGTSPSVGLPIAWSETENIRWKVPLPSWAGSTPAVWDDRVFVTSPSPAGSGPEAPTAKGRGGQLQREGTDLLLLCFSRTDGTRLWQYKLADGNTHFGKQNMASPSPVTDGTHVWAMTGTGILTALDRTGARVWQHDFQKEYGKFGLLWGYASSPLLVDGKLVVEVLHGMNTDDPSYLVALEPGTGKRIWKIDRPTDARDESPDAYTTPTVLAYKSLSQDPGSRPAGSRSHTDLGIGSKDRIEIIVSGGDYITAHDLNTGAEIWRCGGMNPAHHGQWRTVCSPLAIGQMVVAASRSGPLVACKGGGRGNVTATHLAWTSELAPDVPTPVSDGTHLYVLHDAGFLSCLDLATGKPYYTKQRLPRGVYSASPLLADGRLYVTNEDARTTVLATGPDFKILRENQLDDGYTMSSIAVAGRELFVRTAGHLYCIGAK